MDGVVAHTIQTSSNGNLVISPLEFLTPVVPRFLTQDEKENHEWENKPKKCHEPIKKANEWVLLLSKIS